jgi:hypothetical protein
MAMGYGDMNFTTGSSASYIFLSNTSNWEIYYWSGGVNQADSPQTLTGITSCTNGVPVNFRVVALQAGGASVYVNGSDTPAATITGGTFTDKPFWFGGYQAGGVVSYDDVAIVEPVTGPFAPTGLTPTAGDAQVGLTWTSGGDNGAAISDYVIEYKLSTSGSWNTFADGTSASTAATVTGLSNGYLYNFRVSATNSVGTGSVSSTASATPNATAMSDNFTGTTIDTDKWTESDATGLGGTSGRVQQNGSLNITPSAGSWGAQDGTVTLRDRDTGAQERLTEEELFYKIKNALI